jgi:hypothetical protein
MMRRRPAMFHRRSMRGHRTITALALITRALITMATTGRDLIGIAPGDIGRRWGYGDSALNLQRRDRLASYGQLSALSPRLRAIAGCSICCPSGYTSNCSIDSSNHGHYYCQ